MNVSLHPDGGYLVRVRRRGKVHQRWIGKKRKRPAELARRLAKRLRNKLPLYQADRLKKKADSNTGLVGITRSVHRARRRDRKPWIERRFQVCLVDRTGKRRNASVRFTPATEAQAKRKALRIRKEFERAAAHRRIR